jgi:hypothetical protein
MPMFTGDALFMTNEQGQELVTLEADDIEQAEFEMINAIREKYDAHNIEIENISEVEI